MTHFFSMVLGGTQVVLDSSHVRVTYETNQRLTGLKRRRQEHLKRPKYGQKGQKRLFSKETAVFTHIFMVMRETQCLLYSSHGRVPLDLIKPISDNEDHINIRKMHQDLCFSLKITLLAVFDHFEYS